LREGVARENQIIFGAAPALDVADRSDVVIMLGAANSVAFAATSH
jgi:hypothetical protein